MGDARYQSEAVMRCRSRKSDKWFRGGSEIVEVLLIVFAVFHVFRCLRPSSESYRLS